MRKRLLAWLTGLSVAVAILIAGTPAAMALPEAPQSEASSLCNTSLSAAAMTDRYSSNYLPVQRWSDAVPLHSRLPGLTDVGNWGTNLQRFTIQSGLSVGNGGWSVATFATEKSTRFCVADSVGLVVDQATAALGNALIGSGIVAAMVAFAVGAAMFRARRQGLFAPTFTKILLTAGLAVAMVASSSMVSRIVVRVAWRSLMPGMRAGAGRVWKTSGRRRTGAAAGVPNCSQNCSQCSPSGASGGDEETCVAVVLTTCCARACGPRDTRIRGMAPIWAGNWRTPPASRRWMREEFVWSG